MSLVVAFGVADLTGLRWLGAIVLIIGCGWCAIQLWPVYGPLVTVLVAIAYIAGFVLSHPLGKAIGSWLAVVVVALAVAAFTYAVMRPTGRRVSTTSPADRSTR